MIPPFLARGRIVRSRKIKRMGVWIGLAALALQIALAPVFSGRALAMALDPLADAQICVTLPGAGDDRAPAPMDHAGHCADCCLTQCAVDAPPTLPPAVLDLNQPRPADAPPGIAYARPLTRGPPQRALPATGPPSALV